MPVPQIAAQGLNPAALFLPRGETQLLPPPQLPQRLYFGEVPITETATFPPLPAPADAPLCWVYVTLNAEIALSLPSSPWLRRLVHEPRARVSVDGQWLWWALRRKYPQQPLAKLAGSDLIHQLAEHAQRDGKRLLLVGSTAQANGQAVQRLRQRGATVVIVVHKRSLMAITDAAIILRDGLIEKSGRTPDVLEAMGAGPAAGTPDPAGKRRLTAAAGLQT